MRLIDTHAHLYLEQFSIDLDEVIENSQNCGIGAILLPNIDSSTIDAMLSLHKDHPGYCYPMMGLHPCSVKDDFKEELRCVKQYLDEGVFVAVGEIGIDLYWDKTHHREQIEAFTRQVHWAIERDLPVVIHCRESLDETIDLVSELKESSLKGVFHCFTGDLHQAERILDMGFFLGIGGVATFKNGGMDKVIPHVPIESILLETDSPYLAPVPYRGKRNDPTKLGLVAEKVADFQKCSVRKVAEITTQNARNLFKI